MHLLHDLARIVLSVSLCLTVLPIYGQAIDTAAVDEIVEEARKAWAVPGAAVAIVKGDKVIHSRATASRSKVRPIRSRPTRSSTSVPPARPSQRSPSPSWQTKER